MDDVIDRLRASFAVPHSKMKLVSNHDLADAIAEIERLRGKYEGGNVGGETAENDAQDAARFRALMRCGRIKPQGSCGVNPITGHRTYPEDPGTVHFGAEFWVQPEATPSNATIWGRHCLRALADDILAYEAVQPAKIVGENVG